MGIFSRRSKYISKVKKNPTKTRLPRRMKGLKVRGGFAVPPIVRGAGTLAKGAAMRGALKGVLSPVKKGLDAIEDMVSGAVGSVTEGGLSMFRDLLKGRKAAGIPSMPQSSPGNMKPVFDAEVVSAGAGTSPAHVYHGITKHGIMKGPVGPSQQMPALQVRHHLKHRVTAALKIAKKMYKGQKVFTYTPDPSMDKLSAQVGYNAVGVFAPYPVFPISTLTNWESAVALTFSVPAVLSAAQAYSDTLSWTLLDDLQVWRQVWGASQASKPLNPLPTLADGSTDYRLPVSSRHIDFDMFNSSLYLNMKVKIYRLISKGASTNQKLGSDPLHTVNVRGLGPVNDWIPPYTDPLTGTPIPPADTTMNNNWYTNYPATSTYWGASTSPNPNSWGSVQPYSENAVLIDAASPKLSARFKDNWHIVGIDEKVIKAGQTLNYKFKQDCPTMMSAQAYNASWYDQTVSPIGYPAFMITFQSETGGIIDYYSEGTFQYTLQTETQPVRLRVSNVKKYATLHCKGSVQDIVQSGGADLGIQEFDWNQFYSLTYPTVDTTLELQPYANLLTTVPTGSETGYVIPVTTDQILGFGGPRNQIPIA